MNKKCLVILLVLALALTGLCAKDSGFKVGGQLGWGFDIGRIKLNAESGKLVAKTKNNGFALNLTGEYDFNKNWAVRANLGMMFAGKTNLFTSTEDKSEEETQDKKAGLYIDFALDGKYTFVINEKVSLSALSGLEVVAGYLIKGFGPLASNLADDSSNKNYDSDYYNVAFGVNLGLEGSYKLTDKISIVGGATGSWLFVNSAKVIDMLKDISDDSKVSAASFYIRPYVGAQYAF